MFLAADAKKRDEEKAMTDLVVGIADLFAPSPEKVAREKRELEARIRLQEEQYKKTAEGSRQKFEEKYRATLIKKAKQGDKYARMTLILSRIALCGSCELPESDKWYQDALAGNNTDALLLEADFQIRLTSSNNGTRKYKERDNSYVTLDSTYQNAMPLLIRASDLGSVDAMLYIASWYDQASYYDYLRRYEVVTSYYSPYGSNQNKAMEWFKKAADAGSPNAMYYLGMIYKYGRTYNYDSHKSNKSGAKYHVSYDVKKDEKTAFEYFSKAVQPDYVTTDYAKYKAYSGLAGDLTGYEDRLSSHFFKEAYLELALMYEKGKGVPKDKAKAQEYRELYAKYISTNQF